MKRRRTAAQVQALPVASPERGAAPVPLEQGWTLWPHFLVRAAGFPVERLFALAAPATAAAIDRLLDSGKQPGEADALKAVEASFLAERPRLANALRSTAADGFFREAVLWQNRPAVSEGLDPLLRQPPGASDSRTRKKEYLVASYLQRYAAKCDTIGFFGPLGFGRFEDAPAALQVRPGAELLDARAVFFEPWAIAALAGALASDPRVRPSLRPRLSGELRLERGVLYGTAGARGAGGGRKLPAAEAKLLRLCDGRRTARELAKKLSPRRAEALYGRLTSLVERGWVVWGFEVAIEARPEDRLRAQLSDIEDPLGRRRAAKALAELVAARDAVAQAAGDPAQLAGALLRLEETFTRLTGSSASRSAGQTYAGRTVVYEECRRSLKVSAGEALRTRLAAPLSALLGAARWYTHRIAERYRDELRSLHARLGGGEQDLTRFWEDSAPLFDGAPPPPIARVALELERKWARIFALPGGARRVELSGAILAAKARRLFAAPGPGWPGARHHSPDLMIAAAGPAALERGELELVLGEIHPGVHTYSTLSVLSHCPVREALEEAYRRDLPEPSISPIPYEPFARSTHDTRLARADWHLDIGARWRSPRPPAQVVRVGDFVVLERGGRLVARSRDGRLSFDLLQVFERRIKMRAANHFHLAGDAAHTPRVTVDGIVIERERWRFSRQELAFAEAGDTLKRFVAARRWARAAGLPRFVFAKTPEEVKPFFVDLSSPVYVDLLARFARAGSKLTVTEMRPAPEETWLTDASGRTYVSELRLLATDPVPWSAPGVRGRT